LLIKKNCASVAAVKEHPCVFTFLTHPYISLVTGTTQCRVRYTAGWVEINERTVCCKKKYCCLSIVLVKGSSPLFTFASEKSRSSCPHWWFLFQIRSSLRLLLSYTALVSAISPAYAVPPALCFFCHCRLTPPLISAMFFPFLLLPRSIFFWS
jgi:hypothetical protein